MNKLHTAAALLLAAGAVASAQAQQIQITEWMYNGADATGEYVELSNLGPTPVDFSGWSFDDDSRTPGVFSLSGLGIVAPGRSVLMTEASAEAFRAAWNLGAGVAVGGGNTANLGRADEINIFDAAGQLVDRLSYGDTTIAGTIRANNRSGNPGSLADLTPFTVTPGWLLATAGDGFGSYASALGDVGNPGSFALAVPEPASWALMLGGVAALLARRRGA